MAKMTPEQWREYAARWQRAAPELERIHREELANLEYDARIVDSLLEIGARAPYKEETPNGLVIMQYWFKKLAEKQGLIATAARETPASYDGGGNNAAPPTDSSGNTQ